MPRTTHTLRLTYIVAALCALAMLWLVDHSYERLIDTNTVRHEIDTARSFVDAQMSGLVLAESSQRGYMLTGDPQFLSTYEQSVRRIQEQLAAIDAPVWHYLAGTDDMTVFHQLLAQRLDELSLAIRLRAEGKIEAADFAATADTGTQQMLELRRRGARLIDHTQTLIEARDAQYARLMKLSRLTFLVCVLAVLSAFVVFVQQRQSMRQAETRQRQQLEQARDALESEVNERTRDLAELASYLQDAVEKERAHLARELHDELGALMTAAKLDVARLKSKLPTETPDLATRLNHLNQVLNDAIALKRRIMKSLHPSSLANLGLTPSLEILTREFSQNAGVQVQVSLTPVDLDADRALTTYRVVQEALTNAGRHAQATEVTVQLTHRGDRLEILVADNGCGFDPARLSRSSHGLAGMRHRLRAIGGGLRIESALGEGTRVIAFVPIPASHEVATAPLSAASRDFAVSAQRSMMTAPISTGQPQ